MEQNKVEKADNEDFWVKHLLFPSETEGGINPETFMRLFRENPRITSQRPWDYENSGRAWFKLRDMVECPCEEIKRGANSHIERNVPPKAKENAKFRGFIFKKVEGIRHHPFINGDVFYTWNEDDPAHSDFVVFSFNPQKMSNGKISLKWWNDVFMPFVRSFFKVDPW